jgi:ribosomal protein S18 acetylase RimI-like enzyme
MTAQRITMLGSKHLYVASVRQAGGDITRLDVEANNRTQAAAICRKLGFEVCDMYMEG